METKCNCYVQYLSAETRFEVRYGAHDPLCPVYRPTRDPVDWAADRALRARLWLKDPEYLARI